jgi:hypothetical protein
VVCATSAELDPKSINPPSRKKTICGIDFSSKEAVIFGAKTPVLEFLISTFNKFGLKQIF